MNILNSLKEIDLSLKKDPNSTPARHPVKDLTGPHVLPNISAYAGPTLSIPSQLS